MKLFFTLCYVSVFIYKYSVIYISFYFYVFSFNFSLINYVFVSFNSFRVFKQILYIFIVL